MGQTDDLMNTSNGSSISKRKRKSQNPIKCTNSAFEAKMMKYNDPQEIIESIDDEGENLTLDLSKNSHDSSANDVDVKHEDDSVDGAIDLRSKSPKNSPKSEEINNNHNKKMFGPKYPPFNFLINSILSKPSATSDGESESDVSSTNENEDNRFYQENGSFISVF